MSIQNVIRMGHPVLMRPADAVDDPATPEIADLLQDMLDTLEEQQGVGLAAPQIGVPKRVVIFFVPGERGDDDEAEVPMTVLINPWIEPIGDEVADGYEACLSVPGLTGMVPRWHKIKYGGLDQNGQEVVREAEGFHARVVQHECDHLEGIVYPMRMEDMSTFGFSEEVRERFLAEQETEARQSEEDSDDGDD